MVICLERGADLHTTQLMPLPLTVSCFSKIQIGFIFPADPGSPGQRAVKRVCVRCSMRRRVRGQFGQHHVASLSGPVPQQQAVRLRHPSAGGQHHHAHFPALPRRGVARPRTQRDHLQARLPRGQPVAALLVLLLHLLPQVFLQCFDAVGWAAGRASDL